MVQNNTAATKTNKLKPHVIRFRVTDDIYRLLQVKSLELKMGSRPHKYARRIVENNLIYDDTKSIKKAVSNLYELTMKNTTLIKFIMKWAEFYTQSFFASVPEIPKEDKATVGKAAERRKNDFFKGLMSIDFGNGDTVIEEIIADILEKRDYDK